MFRQISTQWLLSAVVSLSPRQALRATVVCPSPGAVCSPSLHSGCSSFSLWECVFTLVTWETRSRCLSALGVTGNCKLPKMGTGNQTPVLWQSKITLNYWTLSLALQFQVKRPPISVHGILNVPYWAYHYYLSKLNTFYDLQICGKHYIKMNGREQNELLKLTIDSKICKRKKTIKLYFTYKHQDKIKHYFMQITSTSSEAVYIFPLRELFSASVPWFTPSLLVTHLRTLRV